MIQYRRIEFENGIIELHPNEFKLILALRNKFRFGEVVIIMRDGVPQRLKKVEVFEDLQEKT